MPIISNQLQENMKPKIMKGYMGHIPRESRPWTTPERSRIRSPPILGYGGWYHGKKEGRVGATYSRAHEPELDSQINKQYTTIANPELSPSASFTRSLNKIIGESKAKSLAATFPPMSAMNHRPEESTGKTLVAGYTGWYPGKINRVVGGAEFIKRNTKIKQNKTVPESDDLNKEIFNGFGVDLQGIITYFHTRLERRFYSTGQQYIYLKQSFEAFDPKKTGSISFDDFQVCLLRLNIILCESQQLALVTAFGGKETGHFQYQKFLQRFYPQLVA